MKGILWVILILRIVIGLYFRFYDIRLGEGHKTKWENRAFYMIIIGLIIICTVPEYLYPSRSAIISNKDQYTWQQATYEPRENGYVMKLEFGGTDTAWCYEAQEGETLNITYALQVNKGRAKVILVGPHGEIQQLIEATSWGEKAPKNTMVVPLKKGKNQIKLVAGKNAKIFFGIQVDKGELQVIAEESK